LRRSIPRIVLVLLALSLVYAQLNVNVVRSWSNGGFSSDPSHPVYGTHDWIAQHALDWLPVGEKYRILDYLANYLYGTELPDNSGAPDGIGDTVLHHVYYWSNESVQDDASAVRARTEYFEALNYSKLGNYAMAAKTLGIMSHYIVDVSVFGHVMGAETDWGVEVHHSDYETYVNDRTSNYSDSFNSYLVFDGSLDLYTAYDATMSIAYDTTFGGPLGLSCTWMDANYNWSDPVFKNRAGESLNLAVNRLADVLHRFYVEGLAPLVRNIDTGMNFTKIQDAIDSNATVNGNVLKIEPAIYYERVNVYKAVWLDGDGRTIVGVDGNCSGGAVIRITLNGVHVRHLTIENSGPWFSMGIDMSFTSNQEILDNVILNNGLGMYLNSSSDSNIIANKIVGNVDGIGLRDSANNNITENLIENSHGAPGGAGMWLWRANCTGNRIVGNTIIGSTLYGIGFSQWASNNLIHHNNFIDNTVQIYLDDNTTTNTWDDGYPSGGNYWSDYSGNDFFRGANQDINGSDGIGDTTYVIDESNVDSYPLKGQMGPTTVAGSNVAVFPTVDVGLIFQEVTASGSTTSSRNDTGPPLPPSRTLIGPYYDIKTTALRWGNVSVRIIYDDSGLTQEQENNLRLLQWVLNPCDISGPTPGVSDNIVNMRDIGYFAARFLTTPSSPNWDPRADVTGPVPGLPDGIVNMRDIGEACRNFMNTSYWEDITIYLDTESNVIYGETSHFSMFGVTRY